MESPSAFRFPARDSQPLQSLSPERVNGTRPTRATKASRPDPQAMENPSIPVSPTRKANVFADFSLSNRTPTKDSHSGLPQSPSLPEITTLRSYVRTNSDVQGLVKRFEHLDVRDREAESAERKKKHEAELRRAQVAREEAESDVKRLREEVRRLKREGDDGHDRERKLGKRLEVVMDEYATSKETYASQASVYEKEVRKARKEAFKSSSAVLKLQEELKSTRNGLRAAQSSLDLEKRKIQQKEQETFSAQYQFVALQEDIDKLKAHMKTVEEERDALKTSLKEEEVARMAAEGMIALPAASQDDDDLMSSPRRRSPHKRQPSPLSDDKENAGITTKKAMEARKLAEELAVERRKRQHADDLVDFLQLECQFRCCACKSGKMADARLLSMSDDVANALEAVRESMRGIVNHSSGLGKDRAFSQDDDVSDATLANQKGAMLLPSQDEDVEMLHDSEPVVDDNFDRSVTMAAKTPERPQSTPEPLPMSEEDVPEEPRSTLNDPGLDAEDLEDIPSTQVSHDVSNRRSRPRTPEDLHHPAQSRPRPSIRTVTTTTTIPMHFTPSKPLARSPEDTEDVPAMADTAADSTAHPATIDREAALAAIAYRRGRAKSIANGHVTPRKQMMEGGVSMKDRRDISAPALGQKKSGASAAKGTASAGRGGGGRTV